MPGPYAEIQGLRQFTRALKQTDAEWLRAHREALVDASEELLDAAKAKGAAQGGVAAKAARVALKPVRGVNEAGLRLDGRRYPYALGAEWGALRYPQFRPWRGNQWDAWAGGPGYFVHPAVRDDAPQIIEKFMERFDKILDRAF